MVNNHLHLSHNVQPVAKQKIIITMNTSTYWILNGENCFVHQPQFNRLQDRKQISLEFKMWELIK